MFPERRITDQTMRKQFWDAKEANTQRERELQQLLDAGLPLAEAVAIVDQK